MRSRIAGQLRIRFGQPIDLGIRAWWNPAHKVQRGLLIWRDCCVKSSLVKAMNGLAINQDQRGSDTAQAPPLLIGRGRCLDITLIPTDISSLEPRPRFCAIAAGAGRIHDNVWGAALWLCRIRLMAYRQGRQTQSGRCDQDTQKYSSLHTVPRQCRATRRQM